MRSVMVCGLYLVPFLMSLSAVSGRPSATDKPAGSLFDQELYDAMDAVLTKQNERKDKMNISRRAAEERCNTQMQSWSRPEDGNAYCPPVFDDYGCWNYTLAGTRARVPCPSWKFNDPAGSGTGFKGCESDGTWDAYPTFSRTNANFRDCGLEPQSYK